MTGADRHSGDRVAALADGRLREPDRSRVLDHLVRCAACRADYDAQLAMKGLLRGLDEMGAPVDLRARLSDLAAAPAPDRPRAGPVTPGWRLRQPSRRPGSGRPRAGRAGRAGVGLMSVTALVLAGAYAIGAAPEGATVTPPIDRFVREHAAVSGGLPLTEPVLWQLPAGSTVVEPTTPSGAGFPASRGAPASFASNRGAP